MLSALLTLVLAANAGDAITFERLVAELGGASAACEGPSPAFATRTTSSRAPEDDDPSHAAWVLPDEGHFARIEEREGRREGVLADLAGPGAVVRIWCGRPRGVLRVYLDGAPLPVLEAGFEELLSGRAGVPEPWVDGAASCYLPIPFAQRCVVTCDQPEGLPYQVESRQYAQGTQVESLRAGQAALSGESAAAPWTAGERDAPAAAVPFDLVLSAQPGGGSVRALAVEIPAPPPGDDPSRAVALTRLTVQVVPDAPSRSDALAVALRTSVLSLSFDGVETVRAPLGDFFATAPGLRPFSTAALQVSPQGELTCRFPMPFRERAELRIEARGDVRARFRGRIESAPYRWSERTLYFHARWRAEHGLATRPIRDWTRIAIQGRGVYVGDVLTVGNPALSAWDAGDSKLYVDGESPPSHAGTGASEDFGFARGREARPHPLRSRAAPAGPQEFGYTTLLRLRRLDAIPFERSLRHDLELVHAADTSGLSLASTSYFYAALDAVVDAPALEPALAAGIPQLVHEPFRVQGALEAEALEVLAKSEGVTVGPQALEPTDEGQWSDGRQLWARTTAVGQFVELALPVSADGEREVIVYPTRSWDYGTVQFSIDGRPAGEPLVTFNAEAESRIGAPRPVSLGVHPLASPRAVLRVEVVGTDPRSRPPHHYFGLDCVVLKAP